MVTFIQSHLHEINPGKVYDSFWQAVEMHLAITLWLIKIIPSSSLNSFKGSLRDRGTSLVPFHIGLF